MGNYLKMADRERILALLELGWSYRCVQRETGVRRETVARYDPRRANAAKVSTGAGAKPARVSTGTRNACEPGEGSLAAAGSPQNAEDAAGREAQVEAFEDCLPLVVAERDVVELQR